MMMHKWQKYISSFIRRTMAFLAVCLVTVAILLSLARVLMPLLNHYKQDFSEWASSFLKKPITIGSVSASIENFEPVFVFKNVRVLYDVQNKQYVKIPGLSIGVDIFDSIVKRQLVASYVAITGMKFKVEILQNGKLSIHLDNTLLSEQNINSDNSPAENSLAHSDIGKWLLSQHLLELRDFEIDWSRYQREHISLHNLDATLTNTETTHRLRGHADVGNNLTSQMEVAADLKGNANDLTSLTGSLYMGGENLPIGSLLETQKYKGLHLQSGRLNIKVWADWRDQAIEDVQTDFNITGASLKVENIKKPFIITQLKADLLWTDEKAGAWSLMGQNVNFIIDGHGWPKGNFSLWFDPTTHIQSAKVSYLDIENVSELLFLSRQLPSNINTLIRALHPQGEINNLSILHQGSVQDMQKDPEFELLHHTYISTQFDKLGVASYQQIPGVENLNGTLALGPNVGQVSVATKDTVLNVPSVFNGGINVDNFSAALNWHFVSNHWHVEVTNANLSNKDINLQAQAGVDFDKNNQNPKLALLLNIDQKDLGRLRTYLPSRVIEPKINSWLTNAFVAGKDLSATVLFHGAVNDFPFKSHQGVFLSDVTFDDMTLQYQTDWPVISDLDANAEFRNNSMVLKGSDGKLSNVKINLVTATIPQLVSKYGTKLIVKASLDGDSHDALQFIHQSPLEHHLSQLKVLDLSGAMHLDLSLHVPLSGKLTKQTVLGKLKLDNDTLIIPSQKLTMTQVKGLLTFDDIGVDADKITGKFFNYPAIIKINTVKAKVPVTYISITSHVKQKSLYEHFKLSLLNYLSGEMDYRALLRFQDNTPTTLQVTSNLNGTAIDLPAPYGKTKTKPSSLVLIASFMSPQKTHLAINYNNAVDTALTLTSTDGQTSLFGGQILFGPGKASFDNEKGLALRGYLPLVDMSVWEDFYNSKKQNTSETTTDKSNPKDLIRSVVLKIDTLKIWQQTLQNVKLSIYPKTEAWQFKVISNDISGSVLYPDNTKNSYIVGDFAKLHLPSSLGGNDQSFDPSTLPKLDIKVDDFLYDKIKLEGIHLKLRPWVHYNWKGIEIQLLQLTSNEIKLDSTGSWVISGKQQETKLKGSATISDLGKVLERWDITNKFRSGSGTVSFSLNWPDSPNGFKMAQLNGEAGFDLSNGRIVDLGKSTESKIGFGKMINVLSVDSILHLGDIGETGYSYSSFTAEMNIVKGNMYTGNALFKGPVADVGIIGSTKFAQKIYDLTLKIEPHLTSSLPILAGVLINPAVGVIAWLADKLIVSPSVDSIAAVNYTMTGPFANPDIKKLGSDKGNK